MRDRGGDERIWRATAVVQGVVWVAGGLWPVVSLASFMRVTGRKREGWLVRTVGALLTSAGAGLLLSAARGRIGAGQALGAAGGAAALAAVDLAPRGPAATQSRVYLADAALHLGLVAAWIAGLRRP